MHRSIFSQLDCLSSNWFHLRNYRKQSECTILDRSERFHGEDKSFKIDFFQIGNSSLQSYQVETDAEVDHRQVDVGHQTPLRCRDPEEHHLHQRKVNELPH